MASARSRQAGSGGKDGLVAAIEVRADQKDRRDAANNLRKPCGFFGVERALQERELAVAEPLLEDLVAAQGVGPDVGRDTGPEGCAVEINIEAGCTEDRERFFQCERLGRGESGEPVALRRCPVADFNETAARHDRAALAAAAPACGELQRFFEREILGEFECGEEGPFGGEVEGGFGVEKIGETATKGGGVVEEFSGCGEWDAGPVAQEGAGVFGAVLRGVHGGQGVEEQVSRLSADPPCKGGRWPG